MSLTQAFPRSNRAEQNIVPQRPVERFANAHAANRPDLTWIFLRDAHDWTAGRRQEMEKLSLRSKRQPGHIWVGYSNKQKSLRAPSACNEDVSTSVAFQPQLLSWSRKQSDAGKEGACSATVS